MPRIANIGQFVIVRLSATICLDMNTNKKFCFVILPGFAVSAMPIAPVENYIRSQGYLVYSSHFWGEQEIKDFSKLSLDDCIEGIHAFVQRVKKETDREIVGVGVSLGGALFIEYAKKYKDLDYIVSIGTPFKLKNRKLISIGLFLGSYVKYVRPTSVDFEILGSSKMVVNFFEGKFMEHFEKVTTPILFLHSKKDNITYFNVVHKNIAKFVNTKTQLVVFENKDHVINYDAEAILSTILKYLRP
jgi:esterase/lipase